MLDVLVISLDVLLIVVELVSATESDAGLRQRAISGPIISREKTSNE